MTILVAVIFLVLMLALFSDDGSKVEKVTRILGLSLLMLVLLFFVGFKWMADRSPAARQAKKNVANSQILEVGMDSKKAVEIMGVSRDTFDIRGPLSYSLYYQPPFAASSGISLVFKDDTLRRINYFH